jgi:AraC family transcriptional regulator of adaptative response/methylated-DNA-[protein]-cysteine methyltransferase
VEDDRRDDAEAELRETWEGARLQADPAAVGSVVEEIFTQPGPGGDRQLPIFLRGTNFQVKVWRALLRIPEGSVVSYSGIANWLDAPAATRAVASAVGRNPIAYLNPCHRVLRSSGEVGGYRWGTARKKAILAKEFTACA